MEDTMIKCKLPKRTIFKKRSCSRYMLLSITDVITYDLLGYMKIHIDTVYDGERMVWNHCTTPCRGITKAMESYEYLYHINIHDALDDPYFRRVGVRSNIPNFFGIDGRSLSVIINLVTEWEECE